MPGHCLVNDIITELFTLFKALCAAPIPIPINSFSIFAPALYELIRAGKLHGVKIGRVQYCVKREIIAYAAPARLTHPSGETYKALVAGYWKER